MRRTLFFVPVLVVAGCGGNANSPGGLGNSSFASDLGTSAPRASAPAGKLAELGENGALHGAVGAIDGPWRRMVDKLPAKGALPGEAALTLLFGKEKGLSYVVVGKETKTELTLTGPEGAFTGEVRGPEKPADPLLIFDRETSKVVEARGLKEKEGKWTADASARHDLRSGGKDGKPLSASGLSTFAGLVRADEALVEKEIGHAVGFVHPLVGKENGIAPGSRYRLRGDFDAKTFSPAASAIVAGLKRYGAVAMDAGEAFGLLGTKDAKWVDADLAPLGTLTAKDFVFVSEFGKEPKAPSSRDKRSAKKGEKPVKLDAKSIANAVGRVGR